MYGVSSEGTSRTFGFPPAVHFAHGAIRDGAAGHGQLDGVHVLGRMRWPGEQNLNHFNGRVLTPRENEVDSTTAYLSSLFLVSKIASIYTMRPKSLQSVAT